MGSFFSASDPDALAAVEVPVPVGPEADVLLLTPPPPTRADEEVDVPGALVTELLLGDALTAPCTLVAAI